MFTKLSRQLDRLLAARKRRQDRQQLMSKAIDAVIAGTDPRIRTLSGYRKKLRPAIKTSILYAQRIVDQIPGPVVLAASNYGTDPTVHACFSSVKDLQSLLAQSSQLHELFRDARNGKTRCAYAFLASRRREKKVFAPALVNGKIQRDVAQTLVSYTNRRIVAISHSGYLARRQLIRRAFSDLIASAMEHLETLPGWRGTTTRNTQKQRLHLQALRGKRDGLEDLIDGSEQHDRTLAALEQMQTTEPGTALGTATNEPAAAVTLDDYLDRIIEVFAHPEKHLKLSLNSIHLTRMNRKLAAGEQPDLNEIRMADARNSRGDHISFIAVRIPRAEMPPPPPPPRF